MVMKFLCLTLTMHSLYNLAAGIFQPQNAESNKVNRLYQVKLGMISEK